MIWGLGLHHPHKFLSLLRKAQPAKRSLVPFFHSKALIHSHLYPDRFYKGSRIEVVRSDSYLTTHPRPLSPLQRSDLGIFQLSPGYSSIFFSVEQPPPPYTHPVPFHWVGISRYLSAEPHSCLDHEWVSPGCFTGSPLPHIFLSRECMFLGSLSHHNKDLERWTLKPSAHHSSQFLDKPCYSS